MLLHRLHAWLLSAMLALAPAASLASQNQLSSPSTGTVSGLQLTNNYNNAIDSVNTCNSGTAAPTNQLSGAASLGNCWLNTTSSPYPVGFNDGSANWPKIGWLDATAHAWNVQIGGGAANLASATTTDLCSVPQNYLTVTGTTTITGFGSTCAAGVVKLITFNNVLTLTYNATSLIIPGAANVSTTAGDQAAVIALGGGNWQVAQYTTAAGTPLINAAIDVGAIEWSFAFSPSSVKYLAAGGQAVSRTTYAVLMANGNLTTVQSATRTNGSPTITGLSDTTQIGPGADIEGAGIPANTTVVSTTASTIVMSANATSSGTANVQVFPPWCGLAHCNGDGSTTFNLPDCRGMALAGRDNINGTARGKLTTAFALANPDALGMILGGQSQILTQAQLPAVAPTFSGNATGTLTSNNGPFLIQSGNIGGSGGPGIAGSNANNWAQATIPSITPSGTISNLGSGNAHSIVPPYLTANCYMRVLP
jgi:microcystin-dependent protein